MIAPQGIIYQVADKAIVGVEHGKPLILDDAQTARIKAIGDEAGYYREGSGAEPGVMSLYQRNPKGSWDDMLPTPPNLSDFCYTLFSTSGANTKSMIQALIDDKKTIIKALVVNPKVWAHELVRDKITMSLVRKFFDDCGIEEEAYLKPATVANLDLFVASGERKMWPEGSWQKYATRMGKVAQRAEKFRDIGLLAMKRGVYFAGSGHILDLAKYSGIKPVGGEQIST